MPSAPATTTAAPSTDANGASPRSTHLIFWENGGITAIINGVPLCSTHHRLVHEGGWTVSFNPTTGITRFEGPRGQIVESTSRLGRAA